MVKREFERYDHAGDLDVLVDGRFAVGSRAENVMRVSMLWFLERYWMHAADEGVGGGAAT